MRIKIVLARRGYIHVEDGTVLMLNRILLGYNCVDRLLYSFPSGHGNESYNLIGS